MPFRILMAFVIAILWIGPVSRGEAVQAGRPGQAERRPALEITSTSAGAVVTAAEIIQAVNALRISHGLSPLAMHPILMEAAADQAQALAISGGAIGHQRPCGLTLGQDLLRRGYPLAGDLALEGYRSENWGVASTAEEAIQMWLGDALHTNTMLAEQRSDIGAAVAIRDRGYVVLITALHTTSGQMPQAAFPVLTAIPATLTACQSGAAVVPRSTTQDIWPVQVSTPLPNGDVFHEVQYGQSLWSIAMAYGTTIEHIRRLNDLPETGMIYPGQKLLIQRQVTLLSSPTATATPVEIRKTVSPPSPSPLPAPSSSGLSPQEFVRQNRLSLAILGLSFLVLLIGLSLGMRKR